MRETLRYIRAKWGSPETYLTNTVGISREEQAAFRAYVDSRSSE